MSDKSKKAGRNGSFCKAYRASHTFEKNKAKRIVKHLLSSKGLMDRHASDALLRIQFIPGVRIPESVRAIIKAQNDAAKALPSL